MFENIGGGEILVLIIAGLFILGPERLPEAAAWLGRNLRKVRDYATGARQHLRDELGPEFDELRKPLEDLRSLRNMDPRKAVTQHLLDGYDPTDDFRQYDPRGEFDDSYRSGDYRNGGNGYGGGNGSSYGGGYGNGYGTKPNHYPESISQQSLSQELGPGERAPFDPDAT